MVAAAGAGPCPHRTVGAGSPGRANRIGTSPPGPFRWGSTTCRVNAAATAASNALPPCSSSAMPAAEASQWVEATMPKWPASWGRVAGISAPVRTGSGQAGPGAVVAHQVAGDELTGRTYPAQLGNHPGALGDRDRTPG